MSLRQIAKILGVHHSTLSKCINGQRKWKPKLKERYEQLATTLPKNGDNDPYSKVMNSRKKHPVQVVEEGLVELRRLELLTPCLQIGLH